MPIQQGIEGIARLAPEQCHALAKEGPSQRDIDASGFEVEDLAIPSLQFYQFIDKIDYKKNFSSYLKSFSEAYEQQNKPEAFVNRKLLEQFLCYHITQPGTKDVIVDLAADKCPFVTIMHTKFGVETAYHQDLNPVSVNAYPYLDNIKTYNDKTSPDGFSGLYKRGLNIVVCNAVTLPFEDNSIDYFYLLNSWEHFQAPADLDVLLEVQRCLKPGGQLLIVPLNIASKSFVMTDSRVWSSKQVYEHGSQPMFRREIPVCDTECSQTYAQHHGLDLLTAFSKRTKKLSYKLLNIRLEPQASWMRGETWHGLLLEKKQPSLWGRLKSLAGS